MPAGEDARMAYPAHWESDAVLADGGTVHLRPITPEDADLLRAFHARLSPETVYNRFFTLLRVLPARDVQRFTTVDHDDRAAVVALLQGELVGVARYDRYPGTQDAEVAIVVEDEHQGRGLGPLLLEHLTAYARERGIERFTASVLPSNRRMLTVFRSAGFEVERELADGYVELSYSIQLTEASLEVMRSREHRAEARSVARLLTPKAVAVLGASREPGTVGHELFRSLLAHGFEGPVYPVNPAAPHVASVRAWADVRDVPDDVDLAVIALPCRLVADAVRACAEKRCAGLVVVSGGFGEAGEQGRSRLARWCDWPATAACA
jgi:RimJ/RimL family protein N-acetyltransferase/predicted CoA-binding protein